MTDTPESPVNTGKTMRRDAARNRQRLLQAAREVYSEQGQNTGVEEIARRAGVGMGTLYRHFPTKDELLLTLRRELLEAMTDRVAAAADAQPKGFGLEACLWSMGAEMADHHGYRTLLWQVFPTSHDPVRQRFWTMIERLLREAQQAGQVRDDLTLTDIFLCQLAVRALIDDTVIQAPNAWRRQLSLMLAGFRPSAQPLEYRPLDDSLVEAGLPRRTKCPPEGSRPQG